MAHEQDNQPLLNTGDQPAPAAGAPPAYEAPAQSYDKGTAASAPPMHAGQQGVAPPPAGYNPQQPQMHQQQQPQQGTYAQPQQASYQQQPMQGQMPQQQQISQGPNGQVVVAQMFGPVPQLAQCPFCMHQGGTVVTKQEGSGHSTCCCLSCLGGGLIGVCCFYMICSEDYMDSVHRCQRCGAVLGVYEKKAC